MERPRDVNFKDGILTLIPENVFKIALEASLYVAAPYLTPIKIPAQRFKTQLPKKGCTSCLKKRLTASFNQVSVAMVSLLEKYRSTGGSFDPLKKYISGLLGEEVKVIIFDYVNAGKPTRFQC